MPTAIKFVTAAAALATVMLAAALVPPASAEELKLGILSCKLENVKNEVVYSEEDFACTYNPSEGANEHYTGVIEAIGVDLTIKKEQELIWGVFAVATDHPEGALAGKYAGGSADVAAGVGAGAKKLVGGLNGSYSLQPTSIAGSKGVGAALQIEKFTLTYKP